MLKKLHLCGVAYKSTSSGNWMLVFGAKDQSSSEDNLDFITFLLMRKVKRAIVEVIGHKAQGAVPEPGYVVIARVTKVMAKMASADIMCLGPKSVQQDVRATEIGKVDMHLSFRPGDIVRALVLSLGDARAYHLSTAKNELGVVSAESTAGATMVPISWTEMQCSLTGQIERRKDCFDLPSEYFEQLPRDLRLDLNDAAFDLSNGPVIDECGQELGELLLNLSRAWELADTSTSRALASKLPMLEGTLTNNAKAAFGKRLVSAGRRFQSMGQCGQGEMQKIAEAMITTGKLLSASPIPTTADEEPKKETRVFKFGELQVEVTPVKANIGAVIGVAFGILSWELAQGIQSIPESSLQYPNDNAILLAKRSVLRSVRFSSIIEEEKPKMARAFPSDFDDDGYFDRMVEKAKVEHAAIKLLAEDIMLAFMQRIREETMK
ncbi:hypothetical protein GH714_022852 [Hevea brasiliensis]|uniref:Exosome complex component CSL4 C-terminal domain-containing protein n=1 Tax=Hevea brasiliensis TaxID=3981 RepID=A0A6A6M2Y5_HEVBR|nr:hypothetical protein GH714_022852 [Hevea brasiliensis]